MYHNFSSADLSRAREYIAKKDHSRYCNGVDYDEDGTEYFSFPDGVKNALDYMCRIGEID